MDLIRTILQIIENDDGDMDNTLKIEGYSTKQINYHLYLLFSEGFIEGSQTGNVFNFDEMWFYITNLTWKGHAFLNATRSEKIWNASKEKIKEIGGTFTMNLLLKLTESLAMHQLGI